MTEKKLTLRINRDDLAKYVVLFFVVIMFFLYIGLFIFNSYEEIKSEKLTAESMGDFIDHKSKLLYDNVSYLNSRFNIMDEKSQQKVFHM